ncbi:MAG: hypothetical protein VX973_10945, partial [Pseudomonadota bacterium]|nr:hypothetical protein [Pseudomonadota bacterium]
RPTGTLLGILALIGPETAIEIEAEAILGAASARKNLYTANEREKARGYARAFAVGDLVHVYGCTFVAYGRCLVARRLGRTGRLVPRTCPTGAGDGRRQIGRCS